MKPVLSILDPSPIFESRTAEEALQQTRDLAVAADAMRYRSYWVQEHHNTASFASTVPEVLIADLAGRTSRLTIGSGGIMLPNYSPLKVAEIANTLSALHPGRTEIGLGRATGADPRASAALLGPGAQSFPQMLRMMLDWVLDSSGHTALPDDHRARGIGARPNAALPEIWMLCSSLESAAFAGSMGLKLAFADFLNPGGAAAALTAYRSAFTPSPFAAEPWGAIGLAALAAETDERAQHLASSMMAWTLRRAAGHFLPYQSADAARQYLEEAPLTPPSRAVVGEASDVAKRLYTLAADAKADELFILSITETTASRIESYRLLDQAWSALI
ncbi:MAG: MsnO8 family LLM class oxidoreductase [Henriciella sp.]|nr:MsnO8 family LLM class oxidoreductase [Henriciella sp.]